MKIKLHLINMLVILITASLFFLIISCDVDHTADNTGGETPNLSYQVIDHNIVTLSAEQVEDASAVRIYLEHASVGSNISGGLDALETADTSYDRTNFVFYGRGNPVWQAKIDDFYTRVTSNTPSASDYNALTMKYCYIDIYADFEYYRDRMLALEALYPGAIFVWWTMPIETSSVSYRQNFNDSVRAYCSANNKILFDIADIECHTPEGVKQTDSSGREVLYSAYTSDGGHLNTAGAQRVARAFWQLAYVISQL